MNLIELKEITGTRNNARYTIMLWGITVLVRVKWNNIPNHLKYSTVLHAIPTNYENTIEWKVRLE